MSVAGLIVAGGAGERMRSSGGVLPKPLVPIRGVSLLERNLVALVRAGIADLHVAVSAAADGVGEFARSRCLKVAEALGATLSVITEDHPLGSIGAAAYLRDRREVMVVNADNLTSLDLQAVLTVHRASGAALTLAVHDQPFPIPFGEVVDEDGRVVAYREKPTLVVRVCSAVTLLGAEALAAFEPGEMVGLPAFANRLLAKGAVVRAYHHDAPWIDVNDLAAAKQAEALVDRHRDAFELWTNHPHHDAIALLLCNDGAVALERGDDGSWCLPSAASTGSDSLAAQAVRLVVTCFGVRPSAVEPLAVLDDIDAANKHIVRTRVYRAEIGGGRLRGTARWVEIPNIVELDDVAPIVRRALAVSVRR
jgi:GTP:adenosylcobinamide-phosphate guanylyltransferase